MNTINGEQLVQMLISACNQMENQKEEINRLNVFPVPDGDTGTNMSLTFSKAVREASALSVQTVGAVSDRMASASLRGARGNSGVILSQFIRGVAKVFKPLNTVEIPQIAQAIKSGADVAYAAVMKPTEGTILTVMRGLSDKALECCDSETEVIPFLEKVIAYGNEVLAKTIDMLPKLKQANVVDAGGKGLMTLFEGALFYLKNGEVVALETGSASGEEAQEPSAAQLIDEEITFGYCTEFIIVKGSGKNAGGLRNKLEKIGDSVVVVEDEDIIKVHVHTDNPDHALGHGLKLGQLINLKIDNMRHQNEQLKKEKEAELAATPKKKYGFVSVASGEGFKKIYQELGIDQVIFGGQSMNPSTDDILGAVKKVHAETIFVFPNNKNIILAAEQAKALYGDNLVVIPTTSMAEVYPLMIMYDENLNKEMLESVFKDALSGVQTGQVTYAVRDSVVNDLTIKEGDIMGMRGSKVVSLGGNINLVTLNLIKEMADGMTEIITVYGGEDVKDKQKDELLETLEAEFPDVDITYSKGEQPIYYYIIAVE